jgi:hypothetical protein
MNGRTLLLAVGSAATSFLFVGALALTVLGGRYGESPGVGILGVVAGVVAAAVTLLAVSLAVARLRTPAAEALVAYAAFGVAFLAIAALRYVDVPGADDVFTFPVHVGLSVLLAVAVAVLDGRRRTPAASPTD